MSNPDKEAEELLPCVCDDKNFGCPAKYRGEVAAALRERDERIKVLEDALIENKKALAKAYALLEDKTT